MISNAQRIQELDADQLEELVEAWAIRKSEDYTQIDRIGGANDKGCDVIGFTSENKHEGEWDLFQCKRKTHNSKLGIPEALLELGKLFFHHSDGAYKTLPRKYWFVAPRGITGSLRSLLTNPSTIGPRLIQDWDAHCKLKISKSHEAPLTLSIEAAITSYNFTKIGYYQASHLAKDRHAQAALTKLLSLPPEEAPPGVTPAEIQAEEEGYVRQLIELYQDWARVTFATRDEVFNSPYVGQHFQVQRMRYFDAAYFERHHREIAAPGAIERFRHDIENGVFEIMDQIHSSYYERLNETMKHIAGRAINLPGTQTREAVRQGMCHHLVNAGRLKWTR